MLKIAIHGYSPMEQSEIQALLMQLVVDRHGWFLEEKPASPTTYNVRFEVGLFDIIEVYAALQQTGIQFTPIAHRALTQMCLCQKHLAQQDGVQSLIVDLRVAVLKQECIRSSAFSARMRYKAN